MWQMAKPFALAMAISSAAMRRTAVAAPLAPRARLAATVSSSSSLSSSLSLSSLVVVKRDFGGVCALMQEGKNVNNGAGSSKEKEGGGGGGGGGKKKKEGKEGILAAKKESINDNGNDNDNNNVGNNKRGNAAAAGAAAAEEKNEGGPMNLAMERQVLVEQMTEEFEEYLEQTRKLQRAVNRIDLDNARRNVFGHLLSVADNTFVSPTKKLVQPLIGTKLVDYYGRITNIRQIDTELKTPKELRRIEKLKRLRSKGKGPPRKGQGKRALKGKK